MPRCGLSLGALLGAPWLAWFGSKLFHMFGSLLGGCGLQKKHLSRAAKRGGFKRGRFPIWTCPSFFVLFCPFWDFPDFSGIFPICAGMVRGCSRFVLFLFLGLLRAPTRNSPERVRDTIWTFPEKSGKHPGLETPRFSFSQTLISRDKNCSETIFVSQLFRTHSTTTRDRNLQLRGAVSTGFF